MIDGIGVDTIDTDRLRKQLAIDHGFKEAIFTADEIAYCETKNDSAPYFAARWAAKEAFLKALGSGLRDGIAFTDIEILRDPNGRYTLKTHRRAAEQAQLRGATAFHVSLAHANEVATAVVVIER